MKLIICLALLFVAQCQDSADTPNILLGNWKFNLTKATTTTQCCMPTGDLQISSNPNNTVTMTSTSWTGAECAGRSASYQMIVNVNGADSYNQMINGSTTPVVITTDSTGETVGFGIVFSNGVDILAMSLPQDDSDCDSGWVKFAQPLSAVGASLAVLIVALFA